MGDRDDGSDSDGSAPPPKRQRIPSAAPSPPDSSAPVDSDSESRSSSSSSSASSAAFSSPSTAPRHSQNRGRRRPRADPAPADPFAVARARPDAVAVKVQLISPPGARPLVIYGLPPDTTVSCIKTILSIRHGSAPSIDGPTALEAAERGEDGKDDGGRACYKGVPVDRQRLIYSGRMLNDRDVIGAGGVNMKVSCFAYDQIYFAKKQKENANERSTAVFPRTRVKNDSWVR